MQKIFLLFLTTLFLQAGEIRVAVAANVSYALPQLQKAFSMHFPQTKVQVILGSSGKLAAQIRNGAPYDLFLSANMKYPEALFAEGSAVTKPIIYARGALAILSPKPRDLSKGIMIVSDPAIKRIAVANTKTAPYGKAAVEAIQHAGLPETVKSKFIYGESISQTLTYTLKAADIGFVAKSALFSPRLSRFQEGKNWVEIDPKLYTPIDQGIVLLKRAASNAEAAAFFTFMLTKEARKILRAFGYSTP